MDITALGQLLRSGEDSLTEFKSVIHTNHLMDPRDLGKQISAFANAKGGILLIGVEDDGTVTGVGTPAQADALMRQVTQVCQNDLQPSLWCTVQKLEMQGALVLVVEVPGYSTDRPYRSGASWYIRDANRSREIGRGELLRLIASGDNYYDEQPIAGTSVSDLNLEAFRSFFASAYSGVSPGADPAKALVSLKCLDRSGGATVAGTLLFGAEPSHWLPDARVSAVRVKGTTISMDILDRLECEGRLLDQIDMAFRFLRSHVPSPSHVEGVVRVEEGVPDAVIREALLNAIVHRDYRAASQVRAFVFDDRLEVVNPGMLLNQLELDSIRIGGISQRRNPVLASLLARAQRRENLGFGIPEMIRILHERKLPEPEFDISSGHFRLVIRFPRAAA